MIVLDKMVEIKVELTDIGLRKDFYFTIYQTRHLINLSYFLSIALSGYGFC
jgi:hypothetical protein